MKRRMAIRVVAVFLGLIGGVARGAASDAHWPQWRGPAFTGAAPDANPPTVWAESTNVAWKIRVPGHGHSSPIVWGDRLFLTTAVETESAADPATVQAVEAATPDFHRRGARIPSRVLRFVVLGVDRADGRQVWSRTVCEELPHAATHGDGSWASGSPVTDGEFVYAYFGSQGLYALHADGRPAWEKRLGRLTIRANFGGDTSPALCGDLVILNQDHEGQSFIVALDKRTGEERWRATRDEVSSWATPLVVDHAGRRQVVTSATGLVRAYDAMTGNLLWQVPGMTVNVIPSPVSDADAVYLLSGFRGSAALAVRLSSAAGDLAATPAALAWSRKGNTPYVSSPLLYDGRLYYLNGNKGELSCTVAATGVPVYEARPLPELPLVYASPVGAGGHVYVLGRDGVAAVVRQGPEFALVASNRLDDRFTASPAVADDRLYLRGHQHLYCIAHP